MRNLESKLNNNFRKFVVSQTRKKFNASVRDLICSKFLKTKKNLVMENLENYMNKKTSLDFILKKLMEFDKVKFILFTRLEMQAIRLIDKPSVSLLLDNHIIDKTQELWSLYEFVDDLDRFAIEKLDEEFKKENRSEYLKKILDLLEKINKNDLSSI